MSAVEGLPSPMSSSDPKDRRAAGALPALCPYLATPDGSWRSASAIREHRCAAVAPPTPLALEKQRRLCLVAAHTACATYGAAEAARPSGGNGSVSRPVARMTPIILDHGRFDVRFPGLHADRLSGQAVLVGVLGIALTAILVARPSGDAGAAGTERSVAPGASEPAPTEVAAASTSAAPVVTEAVPTAEAAATPPPSAPTPAASPTAGTGPSTSGATYKVRSGDTLSAIAARFGTTVRVLVDLNQISDPSRIRIGQVLKLP